MQTHLSHFVRFGIVSALLCLIPQSLGATAASDAMSARFVNATEPISHAAFLHAVVEMNGGVLNTFTSDNAVYTDIKTADSPYFKEFMESAHDGWYLGAGDCYGKADCYAYPTEALKVRVLAAIVVRAFGFEATHKAPRFADNPETALNAAEIQTAADHCVLLPDANGNVNAGSTLTKKQVVDALLAVDQSLLYGKDCSFTIGSSSSLSSSSSAMSSSSVTSSSSNFSQSSKASAIAWESTFSDLPRDSDQANAIAYVQSEGIVGGYSDGTYRPFTHINRAEFTKIVMGAVENSFLINQCLVIDQSPPFSDVNRDEWFAKYVCQAKKLGIIGGYPDWTFRPNQNISFVEAAKILATAFELGVEADGSGEWYLPYVKALEEKSAIPTTIQGFSHNVTRGEMAEFIYRLRFHDETKASLTLEDLH